MGADTRSVQVFGKKKTATAVASCKAGRGLVKVNGVPIELLRPEVLRTKVMLFVKQSQKLLLHTIKNLLMKQQRKRSRKNLFNLTVLSWLLIQDVQNQRNSVDMVLVQDSKNLIVKSFVLHFMIALRI